MSSRGGGGKGACDASSPDDKGAPRSTSPGSHLAAIVGQLRSLGLDDATEAVWADAEAKAFIRGHGVPAAAAAPASPGRAAGGSGNGGGTRASSTSTASTNVSRPPARLTAAGLAPRPPPPPPLPQQQRSPVKDWIRTSRPGGYEPGGIRPCQIDGDLGVDPRPVLLFDLNGTVASGSAARKALRYATFGAEPTRPRPGLGSLKLLLPRFFRLGVYTSAMDRTLVEIIPVLERAAAAEAAAIIAASGKEEGAAAGAASSSSPPSSSSSSQPLFSDPRLILHRGHTKLLSEIVGRGYQGQPFATVKPLTPWFGRGEAALSRVLLVDDEPAKAAPGEEANLLRVPSWSPEEPPACSVLGELARLLSTRGVQVQGGGGGRVGGGTDVREVAAAVSEALFAAVDAERGAPRPKKEAAKLVAA